jgi:parvulin-like peptidyl-prolyl isomerase
MAALGLLEPSTADGLPANAIARVNDTVLLDDDYERAVAAISSDRNAPLTEEDRRFVLDRLIDEELLVQQAIDLGLPRLDRRVRTDLVAAMIQSIVLDTGEREPTEAELRSFLEENADRFTRPGRIHLRQILIRAEPVRTETESRERAEQALARLHRGESFARVRGELGDPEIAPLPDSPVPLAKLRELLGSSAARTALALETGRASDPVRSSAGYHVLLAVAREPARRPELREIDTELRHEWRRQREDRALRRALDRLRRQAHIEQRLPER